MHKSATSPETLKRMINMRYIANMQWRDIAAALNDEGITTSKGRPWTTMNVLMVVKRDRARLVQECAEDYAKYLTAGEQTAPATA